MCADGSVGSGAWFVVVVVVVVGEAELGEVYFGCCSAVGTDVDLAVLAEDGVGLVDV